MTTKSSRRLLALCVLLACSALCYGPSRLGSPSALALDADLAATPPMGWNSWNYFGCNIDEALIRTMANALVSSGHVPGCC